MATNEKVRVLFLCTGNSARSQMAEGLLRKMVGDLAEVHSAGVHPAADIHPLARLVMEERHVDISGQYPKHADLYEGQAFDIVITVCGHARDNCPFFPGAVRRFHWPIPDPAFAPGGPDAQLKVFRAVADELERRMPEIVTLIKDIALERERKPGV